jgi:hypothetical protein
MPLLPGAFSPITRGARLCFCEAHSTSPEVSHHCGKRLSSCSTAAIVNNFSARIGSNGSFFIDLYGKKREKKLNHGEKWIEPGNGV